MGNEEKHGQNDENRLKTMKNEEKRRKANREAKRLKKLKTKR